MSVTEFKGGIIVQDEALRLAVSLEMRGHTLTAKDGSLLVSQGSTLTEAERAAIRTHKNSLLALAAYVAPDV